MPCCAARSVFQSFRSLVFNSLFDFPYCSVGREYDVRTKDKWEEPRKVFCSSYLIGLADVACGNAEELQIQCIGN